MRLKNVIIKIRQSSYWLGVLAFGLFLTACSSDSTSNLQQQDEDSQLDSVAFFGWSNDNQWAFTQHVRGGGTLGETFMSGEWQDDWQSMARFNTASGQFIMGMRQTETLHGEWFIQTLLPTSDLGRSSTGTFEHYYETLVGFRVPGGGTFIFGQTSGDDNRWFIQAINEDGTLGATTDSGHWARFYANITPVIVGSSLYLFGQSQDDDNRWFLQHVHPDGHLGGETDSGHWHHIFTTTLAVQKDGRTYLFGQTCNEDEDNDKYYWFLQEVHSNGKMGSQTDAGYWEHYYPTMTTFATGGETFIFGQTMSSEHRWFIQKIDSGGRMGSTTDSGHWRYYYNFVFPYSFEGSYMSPLHWMTNDWDVIKDRTLKELSFPGAHDAGMSTHQKCYCGNACDTVAQTSSIKGQLEDGARYFDIRPIRYHPTSTDWGTLYTGHFVLSNSMLYGCCGVSLEDVITDVRDFLNNSDNAHELVMLNLSHCYVYNEGSSGCDCDYDTFSDVLDILSDDLSDFIFKCDGCNLLDLKLSDILPQTGGAVIVFATKSFADPSAGIFNGNGSEGLIYNNYSHSNDLDYMENDQKSKLTTKANHEDKLFLLSFTLTLSNDQVVNCAVAPDMSTSILDLASLADPKLIKMLDSWMYYSKPITQICFPNILYVDDFRPFATRGARYMNSQYGNLDPS